MHDLDATRIFWKEWRAQRSFWFGLLAVAFGLEFLLLVVSPLWNHHTDPIDQVRLCQWIVIVLSCAFATGSTAIAFAGEVESKTKGLLQRIPVRTGVLLAGKLSLALVGSYLLLILLSIAGGLMVLDATHRQPALELSPDASRGLQSAIAAFAQSLAWPVLFVVMGGLFSLVMSDVLLTVIVGGLSTAALLITPGVHDNLTLLVALVVAVVVCDIFLARRWIRSVGALEWPWSPRISLPRFAVRLEWWPEESTARASHRSAVAWRRAAGSLMWKEFRQAAPYCGVVFVASLLIKAFYAFTPAYFGLGSLIPVIPLILIVLAPLLVGVAAIWTERRRSSVDLISHCGVTPDGFLFCKHFVWLSLSFLVVAILLLIDQRFVDFDQALGRAAPLWRAATESAKQILGLSPTNVAGPFVAAGFYVLLLYSLGYLLALVLPGPVMALFVGTLLLFAIAWVRSTTAFLKIPFSWTIGPLPVVFLAVSWLRTSDWLLGRNSLAAKAKAAAWLVGSLIAIATGIIIFRVTEIPAVAVPSAVVELNANTISGQQSLFVDAMQALERGPYHTLSARWPAPIWSAMDLNDQSWVKANNRSRDLALKAAAQPPGYFPAHTFAGSADRARLFYVDRIGALADLLLYSARQCESDDHLDDALSCYVAVARLGKDAARSSSTTGIIEGDDLALLALSSMRQWARIPEQTTQRVTTAIRKFESFELDPDSLPASEAENWSRNRQLLRRALAEHSSVAATTQSPVELATVRWLLPWEPFRLERLLDAMYAADFKEAGALRDDLQKHGFIRVNAQRLRQWNHDEGPRRFEATTFALPAGVQFPGDGPEQGIDRLAEERMNLIALAITDFRREHHRFPESLQALVPTYFQRLPLDPWSGGDFQYYPMETPAQITSHGEHIGTVAPFLSSAGQYETRLVRRLTAESAQPSFDVVSRFIPSQNKKPRAGWIFHAPIVWLP
jgi:hypothetical protein